MATISHALILPDNNFLDWYRALANYNAQFERVNVVRSPRGNDLNRFRDITAPQIPGLWLNNDPLYHIRRVYPSVVRVDVIPNINTVAQLQTALNERASRNDRYGTWLKDGHLNDRFVFSWPSDGRPAEILQPFDALVNGRKNEGITITSPTDSNVRAGTAGRVTEIATNNHLGYGTYITVTTNFYANQINGAQYAIMYTNVKNVKVSLNQDVKEGDVLAWANGPTMKIIVRLINGGNSGYVIPNVLNPTDMIYWENFRVRSTVDGLRIREKPGTDYKIVGQVYVGDVLESLEPHGRTLVKLGADEQWLRVRTPLNVEGYTAGWFLEALTNTTNTTLKASGMNLDFLHRLGKPSAARLSGIGWVRLPYKATPSQGFTNLEAAHAFYEPVLRQYKAAGIKVMLILTHQTWGEGAGFVWDAMYQNERHRWDEYINQFKEVCRNVARHYAGKGLIDAYQIWNEQDTPPASAYAAVPIQAVDFGKMLGATVSAIRSVDPTTKIITGGHITGPGNGSNYARQAINAMPQGVIPDGIGVHSYGRGAPNSSPRYTSFGLLDQDVQYYGAIIPGQPIWITEWGVLDMPDDDPGAISTYATSFIQYINIRFRSKIACAMWYAWADTMHNGYGLVNRNDQPKQPFYDEYKNL